MTLRNEYKQKTPMLREAEERALPIYVLKSNTVPQMQSSLTSIFSLEIDPREAAMRETEEAIGIVLQQLRAGRAVAPERLHPAAPAPDGRAGEPRLALPRPGAVPPRPPLPGRRPEQLAVTQPPSWRDVDVVPAPAPGEGRLSRELTRRIGDALFYYGIAGLVLAVVGIVVLLVAASRLNGVSDRIESEAARLVTVLDRTATVLDDAGSTVEDVASTLDSADPMISRVATAITTTVDSLHGLQDSAASVSILGANPLGGLANRFGQVAAALDPLDEELAAFGKDLSSDAAKLRTNVASIGALATELHGLHDELAGGLVTDAFAAIRFMLLSLLAFLAAVAALPAIAALFVGRRIRAEVGPAPAA